MPTKLDVPGVWIWVSVANAWLDLEPSPVFLYSNDFEVLKEDPEIQGTSTIASCEADCSDNISLAARTFLISISKGIPFMQDNNTFKIKDDGTSTANKADFIAWSICDKVVLGIDRSNKVKNKT